jgi:DNA-binding NarL/FixJ family response regulator
MNKGIAARGGSGLPGAGASKASSTRIAIIDDHPLVLIGMRAVLNAAPDVHIALATSDLEVGLRSVRAQPPDVAVIDVPMPGLRTAEFAELCRELRSRSKIIAMVGRRHGRALLGEVLQSGAQAYVLKRSVPSELIRAIRTVRTGGTYVDPELAGMVLLRTTIGEAVLSDREFAVLRLIARGFGTKEVASEVGISIKSVQTYKSRAMKKLRLRTRAEIVRYAIAHDWMVDA